MTEIRGVGDAGPFGGRRTAETEATKERDQKLDSQRRDPFDRWAHPQVERCQHDAGLDPVLALMAEHDAKELPETIHWIRDFCDVGDHRVGGNFLPAIHRCRDEFIAVGEVPIEAALGRAQRGCDRFHGHAGDPSVFDRANRGGDPIVFRESGGQRHRLFHYLFRHAVRYRMFTTIRYRTVGSEEDAMIRNVHQRQLRAGASDVGVLLQELASDNDRLWPHDRWPAMKLSNGVIEGSTGGHGFVRYSVETVAHDRVTFRFDESIGLRGTHGFELEESPDGGCVLRHVLDGKSLGPMKIGWPLVVRPLHDALVEDGLDNAVRELDGEAVEKRRLTRRVRAVRRGISLLTQAPSPTPRAKRVAGDVAAAALAGIGVLHAAWGAGLTAWPGTDARTLAEKVVGGSTFPSASACYVIAGLLGTASGLVAMRSRATDPKAFALSHLGTVTVGSVLLLRGGGGLVVSSLGVVSETAAFRRANLLLYSPLCLALGAAVQWAARTERARTTKSL